MGGALEMVDAQALTMERDSVNKVHTTQRSQPLKPRGYKQNIRNALLLSLFDLQFCMTWVNISLSVVAN
jgi:hypothetical protein